ncbi:tropomodulin family protein [Trichuris trichiura]|uniref:Tropomodulin family protein n=1 Tax=Trichuris trichiura TaxID=36087 RepID=A0A077Z401_TRITR|nr:tropomodulin family protein [Trichuris trichiura]
MSNMTTSYSSSSSYRKTTTTTHEVYSGYRKGSMTTKLYGKDLSEYEDIDIDSLLTKLTPEELEELNNEVDPDNSLLPPSQRCRDQTTKKPTGPFSREQLLKFLEEKAINEKDWEERVPYEPGVKRGKVWTCETKEVTTPTNEVKDGSFAFSLDDLEGDVDIALSDATENDLVDLAGILGMHSMLTQNQYYNALEGKPQDSDSSTFSGRFRLQHFLPNDQSAQPNNFKAVVKASPLKLLPEEPVNDTDVADCTRRLRANDSSLTEVNVNNMKSLSREELRALIEAAACSDHLQVLKLANTALLDSDAAGLVELLTRSSSLKNLNVESNFLSGEFLVALLRAANVNQTLVEIHAENQRALVLGNQVEMDLARAVEENGTLLRVGITFNMMEARYRVSDALEKNYERGIPLFSIVAPPLLLPPFSSSSASNSRRFL